MWKGHGARTVSSGRPPHGSPCRSTRRRLEPTAAYSRPRGRKGDPAERAWLICSSPRLPLRTACRSTPGTPGISSVSTKSSTWSVCDASSPRFGDCIHPRPRNAGARTDNLPDNDHTATPPITRIIGPFFLSFRLAGEHLGGRAPEIALHADRAVRVDLYPSSSRDTIRRGGEAAAPGVGAMRFRGGRGCATWRWAVVQRDQDIPASEVVRQRIPDIARGQAGDAADTIPASLVPLRL